MVFIPSKFKPGDKVVFVDGRRSGDSEEVYEGFKNFIGKSGKVINVYSNDMLEVDGFFVILYSWRFEPVADKEIEEINDPEYEEMLI